VLQAVVACCFLLLPVGTVWSPQISTPAAPAVINQLVCNAGSLPTYFASLCLSFGDPRRFAAIVDIFEELNTHVR